MVLCWHMHQPDYRDLEAGTNRLPWVYLHAIKDYVDMAAHLESVPGARAVVNFVPVLLEQIEDYALQIDAWLESGQLIRDPLLAALAGPGVPLEPLQRRELIHSCLHANEQHVIKRFSAFARLAEMARLAQADEYSIDYFNDQFLADILVWYHLAWMGESVRRNDLRVQSLQKKKRAYTPEDRRVLVGLIGEQIRGIVPRYRDLAEQGRVELSVTPYAHPIIPLLLDLGVAREAMPDVKLPKVPEYPGGEARARWHIRKGGEVFERFFGMRPRGCWPAEGAVCEETLRILDEEGYAWTASGQQVLHNSLAAAGDGTRKVGNPLYRPHRVHEGRLNCFFRDDSLSDLIGFTYGSWHADDAVANLLEHLETIETASRDVPDRVVSIIMDGENAWEYYPRNGVFFLQSLYSALADHPRLRLSTFSDLLENNTTPALSMDRLISGSWVYGTLSTWIGDPDKNRAWDMLAEAKSVYDSVLASGVLTPERQAEAERQLAVSEGSDWFWWFGDYNPDETVSDFERLFRLQLTHLYRLLDAEPPEYLSSVFAHGSGRPEMGGVMRKN